MHPDEGSIGPDWVEKRLSRPGARLSEFLFESDSGRLTVGDGMLAAELALMQELVEVDVRPRGVAAGVVAQETRQGISVRGVGHGR
jgi:hypothetical protein